ncbi:uncharacterized protein TRIADDRAFT_51266 [Trichoplax adhaerens]|uniref:RFX-type winged-helix domain-containing protein n=1 Tax=Trichoplax adhaerens TaxID=10228 RepID=B3RI49_TRIAD|nr:hypothetical protein TRIADDRAFT_51266 [Trichoplax adhaerens]EDV29208.1 hypothetical protein TRIADDRAFT_51266 [Trichoplax adhaerens]|eukprot:XP_002108410.1 hypothetical protein TRIADDRAFT_51266 [Trichoplax adhaerens]
MSQLIAASCQIGTNSPTGDADQSPMSNKLLCPVTAKWLMENYEVADGVSLARSAIYNHYLDFCQKNDLTSANAASFGKIIRRIYPQVKNRRLGQRGQSKFNDQLNDDPSAEGLLVLPKSVIDDVVRSHDAMLPEFPNAGDLNLPDLEIRDKIETFFILYRAHCHKLLDTVVCGNLRQIQEIISHFWHDLPPQMTDVLHCPPASDLICICDMILYKSIGHILVPGTLDAIAVSLTRAIRNFAHQLEDWIVSGLSGYAPQYLIDCKTNVAYTFSKSLHRLTSLAHLAQAARNELGTASVLESMIADWEIVDEQRVIFETIWMYSHDKTDIMAVAIGKNLHIFKDLLSKRAAIEEYISWLSAIVNDCVFSKSNDRKVIKKAAEEFILTWSFISSLVIRDFTLRSAGSFDDYVLALDRFGDIRKCNPVKDAFIWSHLPVIQSIYSKRDSSNCCYDSFGGTTNKSFKKARLASDPLSSKSSVQGRYHSRSRGNSNACSSKGYKSSAFPAKSGMQSEKLLDIVKNLSARVQKRKSDHTKKDPSNKEKVPTGPTSLFCDSTTSS